MTLHADFTSQEYFRNPVAGIEIGVDRTVSVSSDHVGERVVHRRPCHSDALVRSASRATALTCGTPSFRAAQWPSSVAS
jgi:hypothetical protein